jgi:hypothetical protein
MSSRPGRIGAAVVAVIEGHTGRVTLRLSCPVSSSGGVLPLPFAFEVTDEAVEPLQDETTMRATLSFLALLAASCGMAGDATTDAVEEAGEPERAQVTESAAGAREEARSALPTEYFGGISTLQSPGGEFLGASEALIKRVVDRENGTITDSILDDGRLVEVVMRRTDDPRVLSVEPEDGSYAGTLTFNPDPWTATEWAYDIRLHDGTTIEGVGRDNGEALVIERSVVGADGRVRTRMLDRLPRIQPTIYEAKRRVLVR